MDAGTASIMSAYGTGMKEAKEEYGWVQRILDEWEGVVVLCFGDALLKGDSEGTSVWCPTF